MKNINKIILGLIILSSASTFSVKPEMDPISGTIILGTACASGVLMGAAALESFNILSDNSSTSTTDSTVTNTRD